MQAAPNHWLGMLNNDAASHRATGEENAWRSHSAIISAAPELINLRELGLSGNHAIRIENDKGDTREGPKDDDGNPAWVSRMGATYGEILGTQGADRS